MTNQLTKSVNTAGEKAIKSVTFMLRLRVSDMSKINEKIKSQSQEIEQHIVRRGPVYNPIE